MKRLPHSKDLRKGRHSEPNARYFVTFNTEPPSLLLATSLYSDALDRVVSQMEADQQISETSYTVMPDHVHVLFRLGEALTLSQVVGKLKQQSRKSSGLSPVNWQNGYHDHRLRNDSEQHPTLHYIYMNPYRARLMKDVSTWPHSRINANAWKWFEPLLDKDCPYPEWLDG